MSNDHIYTIGDSVLVTRGGAPIPGVIEGQEGERYLVHLAQAWSDETGQESHEAWATADELSPSLGGDAAAQLPG